MQKKLFATLLAATLVFGVVTGPSAFAGKKKKTKTITFEESGSMRVPGPQGAVFFGVTEGEFTRVHECQTMPVSQGHDGWVVEIPEDFRYGTGSIEVLGADTSGAYDLDVYFYDSSCALMEPYIQDGADASGSINPGAAWAVIDLVIGANASFDLKAKATITG